MPHIRPLRGLAHEKLGISYFQRLCVSKSMETVAHADG